MAAIYFVFMVGGAFGYRIPPAGWRPYCWTASTAKNAMIARGNVALENAHKTPQFWLIWLVLCMNVSAGIGVIGAASPMLQETFGGNLFGDGSVGFSQFTDAQKGLAAAAKPGCDRRLQHRSLSGQQPISREAWEGRESRPQ